MAVITHKQRRCRYIFFYADLGDSATLQSTCNSDHIVHNCLNDIVMSRNQVVVKIQFSPPNFFCECVLYCQQKSAEQ